MMRDTIQNMLSSIKTVFNQNFPNNEIFNCSIDQPWYKKLRQKSYEEVVRRDIQRGVSSSNKSKPVGRLQTANVVKTLLSTNTHAAIWKAVYVATAFNSAGRSGFSVLIQLNITPGNFFVRPLSQFCVPRLINTTIENFIVRKILIQNCLY